MTEFKKKCKLKLACIGKLYVYFVAYFQNDRSIIDVMTTDILYLKE